MKSSRDYLNLLFAVSLCLLLIACKTSVESNPTRIQEAPELGITTSDGLSFGDVILLDEVESTAVIHNRSSHDATLTDVSLSDSAFGMSSALPAVIGSGNSLLITLRFSPRTIGHAIDSLTLHFTNPDTSIVLKLSGSGVQFEHHLGDQYIYTKTTKKETTLDTMTIVEMGSYAGATSALKFSGSTGFVWYAFDSLGDLRRSIPNGSLLEKAWHTLPFGSRRTFVHDTAWQNENSTANLQLSSEYRSSLPVDSNAASTRRVFLSNSGSGSGRSSFTTWDEKSDLDYSAKVGFFVRDSLLYKRNSNSGSTEGIEVRNLLRFIPR